MEFSSYSKRGVVLNIDYFRDVEPIVRDIHDPVAVESIIKDLILAERLAQLRSWPYIQ